MKLKQKSSRSFNIFFICLLFVVSSPCFAFSQDSMIAQSDYNADCVLDLADAITGLKVLAGSDVQVAENKIVRMEGVLLILRNLTSDCPLNPCAVGDEYENDDHAEEARIIVLNQHADSSNNNSLQQHSFHEYGDEDWLMFYGLPGQNYTIHVRTGDSESLCDPVVELYDRDGASLLESENDGIEGEDERLVWTNDQGEGTFYVRISNFSPDVFGEDVRYAVAVENMEGAFPGDIIGNVVDKYSGEKITNTMIRTNAGRTAISNFCHCYFYCSRDYCIYFHPANPYRPYTLTAEAPGYKPFSVEVTVRELMTTVLDIEMEPEDDSRIQSFPEE